MIRLREAFEYAKATRVVKKKDLARLLWPSSTQATANANITNLQSGKVKNVDEKKIRVICEYLGVTADYLLGLSDIPTRAQEREVINDCLNDIEENVKTIKLRI